MLHSFFLSILNYRLKDALKEKFKSFTMFHLGKYCSEARRKKIMKDYQDILHPERVQKRKDKKNAKIKLQQEKPKTKIEEELENNEWITVGRVKRPKKRNLKVRKNERKIDKFAKYRMKHQKTNQTSMKKTMLDSAFLTMKDVIRTVHMKTPQFAIRSILGKRYPENELLFQEAFPGEDVKFDASMARKRMKIETPKTWETELSAKGNKPEVWESLINHNQLPYMAMMRNLKNLLITQLDDKVHAEIIRRISDEKNVLNAKIFPFQYFTALQVIDEIKEMTLAIGKKQPKIIPTKKKELIIPTKMFNFGYFSALNDIEQPEDLEVLDDIGKRKIPELNEQVKMEEETEKNIEQPEDLEVLEDIGKRKITEFNEQVKMEEETEKNIINKKLNEKVMDAEQLPVKMEEEVMREKKMWKPDPILIEEYKAAINKAIHIAVDKNLEKIKGHTLIFCDVSGSMKCSISGRKKYGSVTACKQVALLLGLMINRNCEKSTFFIFSSPGETHHECYLEVKLMVNDILKNMKFLESEGEKLGGGTDFPFQCIREHIEKKIRVDNIVILSDMMISDGYSEIDNGAQSTSDLLNEYRNKVNSNLKIFSVDLSGDAKILNLTDEFNEQNYIRIFGMSDKVLKFISVKEKGTQIDEIKKFAAEIDASQITQKNV